jgi:hypothetical protein
MTRLCIIIFGFGTHVAVFTALALSLPAQHAILAIMAWLVACAILGAVMDAKLRVEWTCRRRWFDPYERWVFRAEFGGRWRARLALRLAGFVPLTIPGHRDVYERTVGDGYRLWQVVAAEASGAPEDIRAIAEMDVEMDGSIRVDMCVYRDGMQFLPKTDGIRWSVPNLGEADRWAKFYKDLVPA